MRPQVLQPPHEPERAVAIQIVSVQVLHAHEAELFVEPQRGGVVHLRLQHDLVGAALAHALDGPLDEPRSQAVSAVRLLHRQHGDVAAVRAALVPFLLADDDADELPRPRVERLVREKNKMSA
jgi:hypothetical protein